MWSIHAFCLWNSRADDQHWQRKDWPVREELVVGENNVINEPLVDRDRILPPPLHIKLGVMKQFVKALDKNADCFRYIRNIFPATSYEKVKAGIFDGPQIRTLMKDPAFVSHMTVVESATWCSYVSVVKEFLGKKEGRLLTRHSKADANELSNSWGKNEHKTPLPLQPPGSISR